ncbi:MAG: proton-conducting transporter membrane subunit [Vicinamibacterales bacterium]
MSDLTSAALAVSILAPLVAVLALGGRVLLGPREPSEETTYRLIMSGLIASTLASWTSLALFFGVAGEPLGGEVDFGSWLLIHDYQIPAVLLVDGLAVTISVLASTLTTVIARFSRSYLHKEPGFTRFFAVLGMFATGTQLIGLAGALELFFAGWELIGIASALFIGFFHERDEPVRSSIRAFATYRLADTGLLIATVVTFEMLGSARFSALDQAATLSPAGSTLIALCFLLAALGKSAQLPFSEWLPRAMEGPTPSSALFYGAVSIHAGLFLLLRVWPVLAVSPTARVAGVAVGLATAVYAATVARTHTDAKGALAHATLTQVGLILAEICLGWTELALTHLVCHALLRLGQYLKAPNMIHDSHRMGHGPATDPLLARVAPRLAAVLYAQSLHRLRLDDRLAQTMTPVLALARWLDAMDGRLRRLLSADRRPS